MENKLKERGIELQKLSEFTFNDDGNIVLTGAMGPVLGAQEVISLKFPEWKLTQLYRIWFDDDRCTTWQGSDGDPVLPDLLVMELKFRYIAIGADFGCSFVPILLSLRDKPISLSQTYNIYKWIKKASVEDFELICNYVESKFEENRQLLLNMFDAKKMNDETKKQNQNIPTVDKEFSEN